MSGDTSETVERQLRDLYRSRSAGDRVSMAMRLFADAKRLATAGLVRSHPGLTEVELRVELLRRLHGDDLTISQRAIVAASSRRMPPRER